MKPGTRNRRSGSCVLDASALLAFLQGEPGFERVSAALAQGAACSAVNAAEVYAKALSSGIDPDDVSAKLQALGLEIVAFDEGDARSAARLVPRVQGLGLSLADRACLVLSARLGRFALTTDRAWRRAAQFKVELLR